MEWFKRRSREINNTKYDLENTQYSGSPFWDRSRYKSRRINSSSTFRLFHHTISAHIGWGWSRNESIETKCVIDFQDGSIVSSHLSVNAKVNGITEADFQELWQSRKKLSDFKITK
jgi:osmotically inducible protein OsmC